MSLDSVETRPNIAFAGLTAAGKTTHAKILAEQLGYEYVSATQTILDILDMKDDAEGVWFAKYDEIEKAREGDRVDIELEARMQKLADNSGGLILDTWAMAWLYEGNTPMVRVWLNSDEASRARKCYVSQGDNITRDIEECGRLVTQKDNDTRANFLRRLHFDLFTDMGKYDIIVDNTNLIPEATRNAADRGIAQFTPVVRAAVDYAMRKILEPTFDLDGSVAEDLLSSNKGMIRSIGGFTL